MASTPRLTNVASSEAAATKAALPRLGERASGILLHPTSLPGPHGNGDLGEYARRFVDFLVSAEQSFWQMLPVAPCGYGDSPYSAQSAFAGNPLLIALPPLQHAGYLTAAELDSAPPFAENNVDYPAVERFRTRCLRRAFEAAGTPAGFQQFCQDQRAWLDDYALFRALKSAHGDVEWTRWPAELRDREPAAIAQASRELAHEIEFRRFEQWLFSEQWQELRQYCHARGVALIGDIPIFLAHDSADVWQHQGELFWLDQSGSPTVVSGVPPDYFSPTGQRWGNPLYRWEQQHETGYRFWLDRMRAMLARFDVVRLDHFIGFERYWEVPASDTTAVSGRWVQGPQAPLFHALEREFGETTSTGTSLPFIAEDLGEVTPGVRALRDQFGLPGTKILQFAFGTDPEANTFLPHNYPRRAVVYPGTHDNDTIVGWFRAEDESASNRAPEQAAKEQEAALAYLGVDAGDEIHWDMIRLCMMSVADTAIFALQDVLGLGSEARMNWPGRADGNWRWRTSAASLTPAIARRLGGLTRLYQRQPRRPRDVTQPSALSEQSKVQSNDATRR